MTTLTATLLRGCAYALMIVPVAACAQPVGQTGTAHASGGTSAGMTLKQFVTRHDRKQMAAADTDGDGRVSRAEFIAAAKAGRGNPGKRFAKIDRNGDGMLDKTEIDTNLTRRFARLDSNDDGTLGADERAAAHAGKGRPADDAADS